MKQVTSARGPKNKMGGSDPCQFGFQPPRHPTGSLPPCHAFCVICFGRVVRVEAEFL
jgi:hypothetical protein